MRTLVALCLVALAMGQPLKKEVKGSADHIQKREIAINGEPDEVDCSQLSGDALAACNEKRVKRGAEMGNQTDGDQVKQTEGGQDVNGTAHQDSKIQEAWSKEGAYARQGEGGQFISASDKGGPIVQIIQHVFSSNCCACGCNCGCPGEEGPDHTESAEED